MTELWDVLDLAGLPTGRTVARVTDGGAGLLTHCAGCVVLFVN
jgi:hypothetical protein